MKRVRSHKIEDLSDGFLRDFFVDWVCNKLHRDYALDFVVVITEGESITEINFFVQNKGTDSLKVSGNYVNLDIEPRYLIYYSSFIQPVLIIHYDAKNDCAYWINAQKYVKNVLDVKKPKWRNNKTSIRIKIPLANKLMDIEVIKNEIINSLAENIGNATNKLEFIETRFYKELKFPSISDLIDVWSIKSKVSFYPKVMLPIIFAEIASGNITKRQWGFWIKKDLLLNTLNFGLLIIFCLINKCKEKEKEPNFITDGMEYLLLYSLLRLEVGNIVESIISTYNKDIKRYGRESFFEKVDFIFKPIIASIFYNFLRTCRETIEISCRKCNSIRKGDNYFDRYIPYELLELSKHTELIILEKEKRCEIGIIEEGEPCPLLNTSEDYEITDKDSLIEVLNFIKKVFLNIRDTIFRRGG